MTIKNIVLSGTGHLLLTMIGIIDYLFKSDILQMDNIENLYGTSGGSLIAAIICINVEWGKVVNYFMNRPWCETIDITIDNIYDVYEDKGLINNSLIQTCLKPLLLSKNLSSEITLIELYNYSNIELHIFTFELNKFETVDMSYKTHPDILLYDAIHMSCSIPCVMAPICSDTHCYIDGGILQQYPIYPCLLNNSADETLGIFMKFTQCDDVTTKTNVFDFITFLSLKLIKFINNNINNEPCDKLKYEIIHITETPIKTFINAFTNKEQRFEMFNDGYNETEKYIKAITN
jgi:predicted acylesterase/phospholipase RssA